MKLKQLEHDFTFVCKTCGRILERDTDPHGFTGDEYSIECCGEHMQRVYPNVRTFSITGSAYLHTKYSDAMAVSLNQIAEHKQVFPGVKIDNQGRPGFDTVQQQDKYLKASGMVKYPQKIRKLKQLT